MTHDYLQKKWIQNEYTFSKNKATPFMHHAILPTLIIGLKAFLASWCGINEIRKIYGLISKKQLLQTSTVDCWTNSRLSLGQQPTVEP